MTETGVVQTAAPPPAAAAECGLWAFSLAFYPRPGVAPALEALQDEAGLDVNLMLFALWLGLSGRGRLDRARLEAARQAVGILAAEVTRPLRELRRRLKGHADSDILRLREAIKTLELEAERAAQRRLAALAGAAGIADATRRIADAEANLALVLGQEASAAAAKALRRCVSAFARDIDAPEGSRPSA